MKRFWILLTMGLVACESSSLPSRSEVRAKPSQEAPFVDDYRKLVACIPDPQPPAVLGFFSLSPGGADPAPFRSATNFPPRWRQALVQLGWNFVAQANYRTPSKGFVHILVGRYEHTLFQKTYQWLVEHQKKASLGRARRKRKKKKSFSKSKEIQSSQTLGVPPRPADMSMPWGVAPGIELANLAFVESRKIRIRTPLFRARLAISQNPDRIALVLFDSEDLVKKLFAPATAGRSSLSTRLSDLFSALPEELQQSEKISIFSMVRFGDLIAKKQKTKSWYKEFQQLPTYWVTVSDDKSGVAKYQFSWINCESPAKASILFDQGFVARRREEAQRIVNSKRVVRYKVEVGVVTIGNVQGFQFVGLDRGRFQEVYFQKGHQIWLARTPMPKRGGLALDDLLDRLDLLPLWEESGK